MTPSWRRRRNQSSGALTLTRRVGCDLCSERKVGSDGWCGMPVRSLCPPPVGCVPKALSFGLVFAFPVGGNEPRAPSRFQRVGQMNAKHVLDQILARNGLGTPDGRALWEYCALADEIAGLCALLVRQSPRALSLAEQGAFALVTSYVQCPDDVAPEWTWDLLKRAIPWAGDPNALYKNLAQGLELYWRRPIRRYADGDHRTFLGTCFTEGGLPAHWLASTHNVGLFIRSLMRRSELYGVPSSTFAKTGTGHLAEGIQSDEVYELCSALAQHLVSLRAVLPAGCDAPTRYLDAAAPGWRDKLPLRVARARSLDDIIDSLLDDAAVPEESRPLIDVVTLVERSSCVRRLLVASRVSSEQLAIQAGVTMEDAGGLLYLLAQTSSGSRKQLARLERERGDASHLWRVYQESKIHEFTTDGEVRIIVSIRGEQRGQFTPPGAEALDHDVPWTLLAREEGRLILRGTGSTALSEPRALVSLPREWPLPTAQTLECTLTPSDFPAPRGRVLFELSGRLDLEHEGEHFHIATSASASQQALLLSGRRLELAGTSNPPYIGPPHVLAINALGRTVPLSPADLSWRRADGGPWQSWFIPPMGAISIRATNGGRARANVVPPDFRVRSDKTGNLRLSARRLEAVVVGAEVTVEIKRDAAKGFCVTSDASAPEADVSLTLCFANATPFSISVPLHGERAGFVDETGRWLPSGIHLSLDRLDRIRARGRCNVASSLEVRAQQYRTWDWLSNLPNSEGAVSEVYLADMRDELTARLRSSGELDDKLELRVATLGVQAAQYRALYLGHFWIDLEGDATQSPVKFKPRAVSGEAIAQEDKLLSGYRLDLAVPTAPLEPLQRDAEGHFVVETVGLKPGPYLALVQIEGRVVGRPRLIVLPGDAPASSSAYATAATRQTGEERKEAWAQLCVAMADDWAHPDWLSFHHLLRHGRALPASTFEFMRSAAQAPAFLAAAFLHAPDHLSRLDVERQLEEAGAFWPSLPITSWFAALRALQNWLCRDTLLVSALGGEEAARRTLCPVLYDDSKEPELRFLSIVREMAKRAHGVPARSCLSFPPPLLSSLVLAEKQGLLSRHAEDQWPQQRVSSELARLASDMPDSDDPAFRRAVLQAPYLAAKLSVRGQVLECGDGWALRALRSFDRDWFDAAHTFHLATMVKKMRKALEGSLLA